MLLTALLHISVFQGFVLGGVIFKSPLFKTKSNTYLAYAMLCLSILLLNLVFDITNAYQSYPVLFFLDALGLEFVFIGCVLLAIIHHIKHPIRRSRKRILLFSGFFYAFLINFFGDFAPTIGWYHLPKKIEILIEILLFLEILMALVFIPSMLGYGYYLIKKIKNKTEKKWFFKLLHFISCFLLCAFIAMILDIFMSFNLALVLQALAVVACFCIHWSIYTGIFKFKLAKDQKQIKALLALYRSQNTIALKPINQAEKATLIEKKPEKCTKENLHFQKLEALFQEKHIYKDHSLDREKIADILGISPGYVSTLINTITDNNFTAYVNQYRVNAVKQIMLDPAFKNYSLLAIGLECGFSSKSTFFNTFKKITGTTPNAYRKAQEKSTDL